VSVSVCLSVSLCIVDGLQQSVNLIDSARGGGSQAVVAQLTIAFTGTTFDMDKFPDRTTRNGVTNGQCHLTTLLCVCVHLSRTAPNSKQKGVEKTQNLCEHFSDQ